MTTQESNKLIADSCGIKIIDGGGILMVDESEEFDNPNTGFAGIYFETYDPSTNMNQLIEAIGVLAKKMDMPPMQFLSEILIEIARLIPGDLKTALYNALIKYLEKLTEKK
jgi:hypothetical protein